MRTFLLTFLTLFPFIGYSTVTLLFEDDIISYKLSISKLDIKNNYSLDTYSVKSTIQNKSKKTSVYLSRKLNKSSPLKINHFAIDISKNDKITICPFWGDLAWSWNEFIQIMRLKPKNTISKTDTIFWKPENLITISIFFAYNIADTDEKQKLFKKEFIPVSKLAPLCELFNVSFGNIRKKDL